jgi:hypothetical protein
MYPLSLGARLLSAAVLGKIIAIATVNTAFYGMKIGLAVRWGFVTTVQLTFSKQPAKPYAINPRLSARMLSRDGCDSRSLATKGQCRDRYSVIKPPVRSASREMSCSTHQFWSSSTIFSVEHGSQ